MPIDPIPAIEDNLTEMLTAWGCALPGGEASARLGFLRYVTGIKLAPFNGLTRVRWMAEEAPARVAEALAYFRARGLPMFWWLGPSTQPADLGAELERQGLVHGSDEVGMALDLAAWTDEAPAPAGLTIMRVTDEADLRRWVRTMSACFTIPAGEEEALLALFRALGFDRPTRYYLGLLDGEPAATAALFVGGGAAGVHWVGTLPQARRRGLAAALTTAVLRDARVLRERLAVLHASPQGLSVYRRLGFREDGRIGHYHT